MVVTTTQFQTNTKVDAERSIFRHIETASQSRSSHLAEALPVPVAYHRIQNKEASLLSPNISHLIGWSYFLRSSSLHEGIQQEPIIRVVWTMTTMRPDSSEHAASPGPLIGAAPLVLDSLRCRPPSSLKDVVYRPEEVLGLVGEEAVACVLKA